MHSDDIFAIKCHKYFTNLFGIFQEPHWIPLLRNQNETKALNEHVVYRANTNRLSKQDPERFMFLIQHTYIYFVCFSYEVPPFSHAHAFYLHVHTFRLPRCGFGTEWSVERAHTHTQTHRLLSGKWKRRKKKIIKKSAFIGSGVESNKNICVFLVGWFQERGREWTIERMNTQTDWKERKSWKTDTDKEKYKQIASENVNPLANPVLNTQGNSSLFSFSLGETDRGQLFECFVLWLKEHANHHRKNGGNSKNCITFLRIDWDNSLHDETTWKRREKE